MQWSKFQNKMKKKENPAIAKDKDDCVQLSVAGSEISPFVKCRVKN